MFLYLSILSLSYSLLQDEEPGIWRLEENNFEEGIQSKNGLLVYFYSPEFNTSNALSSVITATGEKLRWYHLHIGKMNIDTNEEIVKKYQIPSYPVLIYFINDIQILYTAEYTAESISKWLRKRINNPYKFLKTQKEIEGTIEYDVSIIYVGKLQHEYRKLFDMLHTNFDHAIFSLFESGDSLTYENYSLPLVFFFVHKNRFIHELTDSYDSLNTFINTHRLPDVFPWNSETEKLMIERPQKFLVFLINKEEKGLNEHINTLTSLSIKYYPELFFTYLDLSVDDAQLFKEKTLLSSKNQPLAVIIEFTNRFLKYTTNDLSFDGVDSFINAWYNQELKPLYLSDDVSSVKIERNVKVVVADTFKETSNDPNNDVMILFYIEKNQENGPLMKLFERVAYETKKQKNLLFYKFDLSKNEYEGLTFSITPAMVYYPRNDKSGKPYTWFESKYQIMEFIRGSRREWVY